MPILDLSSFKAPVMAAVFGSGGGIGAAMVQTLAASDDVARVFAFSRGEEVSAGKIASHKYDPSTEEGLKTAFDLLQNQDINLVISAIGTLSVGGNGPEKAIRDLGSDDFLKMLEINTVLPSLIARHSLPLLKKKGRRIFAALSARVGSISDNRLGGWYSYRASKAALNQIVRTFSIELSRYNSAALAVALHPGTVDTDLSRPFQQNVPEGKLFTPAYSAQSLLEVLDRLHPDQSGNCFDYAGTHVPA